MSRASPDDHLAAFKRYGSERVLIAYDRDEAGERAAEKLAKALMACGIECYRIQFPKGMDANAYALKVSPPAKSLGIASKAVWLGKGKAPERPAARATFAIELDVEAPAPAQIAYGPSSRSREPEGTDP